MPLALLVILLLYLAIQAAQHLLTMINLHHLRDHGHIVPTGFADAIDPAKLATIADYTISRSRLTRNAALLNTGLTIALVFAGLLNWYNTMISQLNLSPIVSSLLFFLLLLYAETLINLPFSLYSSFVIEQRFGFNRQTVGLWIKDLLKGLLLSTILYGLLITVIFWLMAALPHTWWLAAWLFVALFSILMLYLTPVVIAPLFNTYSPVADASLVQQITTMLAKVGISVSQVFSMNASKRSGHSNAYFTGIGKVKRIVLFDTLLASHGAADIIAILAHEAGHWKRKHLLKMLALSQAVTLAGFYVAYQLLTTGILGPLFGISRSTPYSDLFLVGFLGSMTLFFLQPLANMLSRHHETEADDFAVAVTGDPHVLADSLISLGQDNLANLHPHPWYAWFHYSHPPLVSRVQRLYAMANSTAVRP